jgi:hypothetical protein
MFPESDLSFHLPFLDPEEKLHCIFTSSHALTVNTISILAGLVFDWMIVKNIKMDMFLDCQSALS